MQEQPIDRLMRRGRGFILVLTALCFPIFLISYGFMVHAMLTTWGWWAVPASVAHCIGWLGIASLFDIQQERRQ